jgi:hypothetical protein
MTTDVLPRFTRRRIDRGEALVPLAFIFDSNPVELEHVVTVVDWTRAALQALRDLTTTLPGSNRGRASQSRRCGVASK